MSINKSVEPLSDHPLFRALVLMGGGLALGCGGVSQSETPIGIDIGSSAAAGSGSAGNGAAGLGGATSTVSSAGASASGASSIDSATYYNPSCPYAQWDCRFVPPPSACYFYLKSKDDPVATGCVCDHTRPTSAADCKANETLLCRQAFPPYEETQPAVGNWDGTLHVQCACIPTPAPDNDCNVTCLNTYGTLGGPTQCFLPDASTCDANGVCTATSADVLRQDGIMCGCADISLK